MNDRALPPGFDRADWKAAAHLPWALRNTARFLPTAAIARSDDLRRLVSAPGAMATGSHDWDAYLEQTHTTAVVVCADSRVIDERYRLGAVASDRQMVFSITKSVTGLLAAMLSQWGVIEEDRQVDHYLPDLAGSAFGQARIDALLAMTDGVAFDEHYTDPDAQIHVYSKAYWGSAAGGTRAALAALHDRGAQPGRFAYRTPVADVIAHVIARATGRTLPDLVADLIWSPMGAECDAAMVLDTAGEAIGGTGLCAAPRDLARLGLLLCEHGKRGTRAIVPVAVIERLFAGGDPAVMPADRYPERVGWSYAALWWHPGKDRIAAIGVHGQMLIIDRAANCVLVHTGASPRPDNTAMIPRHFAAFDAIGAR